MKHCDECIKCIDLYLDNELRGNTLDSIDRHIKTCAQCRARVWSRRLYLERIRLSRPLYAAPVALRERVEQLLEDESTASREAPMAVRRAGGRSVRASLPFFVRLLWLKPVPAFASVGLAIGLLMLWTFSQQEARATAFVDMAVKTHQQQLSGHIPIEITTDSPAKVVRWFTDKVPFPFRLPTYQEQSGQAPPYKLVGGRLINFRSDYAAYVAYQMNDNLVSLIVTSGPSSLSLGGETTTTTKGLTFHSHQRNRLQVVTWSAHNLNYALVSSVSVPARRSCAVCHTSSKNSERIQNVH